MRKDVLHRPIWMTDSWEHLWDDAVSAGTGSLRRRDRSLERFGNWLDVPESLGLILYCVPGNVVGEVVTGVLSWIRVFETFESEWFESDTNFRWGIREFNVVAFERLLKLVLTEFCSIRERETSLKRTILNDIPTTHSQHSHHFLCLYCWKELFDLDFGYQVVW